MAWLKVARKCVHLAQQAKNIDSNLWIDYSHWCNYSLVGQIMLYLF